MRTRITQIFNIEAPIFAFSHCRDVVVEVSKAGGFGVLGATRYTPEELEIELSWIDDHIGGLPYGVDVLVPHQVTKAGAPATRNPRVEGLDREPPIPAVVHEWAESVMRRYNVPPLPPDQAEISANRETKQASKSPAL